MKLFTSIYHKAGAVAIIIAFILAIKAAGMADLGGDFNEMVTYVVKCAVLMGLGGLLIGWKI